MVIFVSVYALQHKGEARDVEVDENLASESDDEGAGKRGKKKR